MGADRGLDTFRLPSQVRECSRDCGFAYTVSTEDVPLGWVAAFQNPPDRLVLEGRPPEPAQLRWRAGQDDGHRPVRLDDEPRRRACDPDHSAARGHRRLLPHACLELRVGTLEPLRDPPRDVLDLPLELRVDERLEPRGASQELDGAVVVGRAEPARDHEQVGGQALPDRAFQLGRLVPDERDPRRLQPEPGQLLGQEWAVRVPAPAADQLAAGDQDR